MHFVRLKARTKHGEKNVFLIVDLRECVCLCVERRVALCALLCVRVRFLPTFCPEFTAVSLEVKKEADGAASKEIARRLEIHLWALAWDSYALAATMLDQVWLGARVHRRVWASVQLCCVRCLLRQL